MFKNIKKFLTLLTGLSTLTLPPILLSSCSSNAFYLANFQSYMSPDLMELLKNEYGDINYRYYGTNENLERSFYRFDVSVPSTYLIPKLIKNDLLEPINWESFNLHYKDEKGTSHPVKNANDALNLFNSDVQYIVQNIYQVNGKSANLLEYAVPYFMQDFIFGYKGEAIPSLHEKVPNKQTISNVGWREILETFSTQVGKGKKYNSIAMIDDYRTVYSVPSLMSSNDKPDVNPPSGEHDIAFFRKVYENLSNKFSPNSFLLNSDSNAILNTFANPRGSDVGIMYNGDLLYALQGGDEYANDNPFANGTQFNYVRPKQTLIALDMMVINKKSKNKNLAHEIIKRVALEGSSSNDGEISEVDKEDNYVYGPMINFDYVMYTSPLKKIHEYVLDQNDGYFSDLKEEYGEEFVKKSIEIYDIETNPSPDNMIETSLSELNKSNMYYAYLDVKRFL